MNVESSEHHGIFAFKLSGILRADPDGFALLEQVRKVITGGVEKIVIDLEGLERINSGGVGVLASVVTSADNAGALLGFSTIPAKVEKLIVIVGLMRVLKAYPTLQDALADLGG